MLAMACSKARRWRRAGVRIPVGRVAEDGGKDTAMPLKDSCPQKWVYREHTRVKHEILRKYLGAWLRILGSRHKRLIYFDTFAGRAEYQDEVGGAPVPGSPVMAMRVANELIQAGKAKEIICVFIERDPHNFANLTRVVQRCRSAYPNVNVLDPIQGEFAVEVAQILRQTKTEIAPSFFFLDPFGFAGVPFSIVKEILSHRRTEVFFTFMGRDINRFLTACRVEDVFDSLFGTGRWREFRDLPTGERERALRQLYIEQLRSEARVRYTWSFRVCHDDKVQTLYYLIHATNNFKGLEVMKGIMHNQGPQGTFAYLGR